MAIEYDHLVPGRTYATKENMLRAIKDIPDVAAGERVVYYTARTETGRFYPIFFGRSAVHLGLFTRGFIVIT